MTDHAHLYPPDGSVRQAVEDPPPEYSESADPVPPLVNPTEPPPEYSPTIPSTDSEENPHTPPEYLPSAVSVTPPDYSAAALQAPPLEKKSAAVLGFPPDYSAVPGYWMHPPPEVPVIIQPGHYTSVQTGQGLPPEYHPDDVNPSLHMALACFVYWCCNCLAGTMALAMAMASSDAVQENRMDSARKYRKASFMTSLIGVVLGISCMVAIIVLTMQKYDTNPKGLP